MKSSYLVKLLLTSIVLASLSNFSQPVIVSQVFCDTDEAYEPPASTTRTVDLPRFGIRVAIPSNYRTMQRQDGSVQILHPKDYQWIQCLLNGGTGAHGYYSEMIELVERDSGMSLQEQASLLAGYSIDEQGNRQPIVDQIFPYEKEGISGYIVTSISGYSVTFLGTVAGQSKLLQVSAGCDCEVEVEAVTDLLSRIEVFGR